jgi:hypothetical protein
LRICAGMTVSGTEASILGLLATRHGMLTDVNRVAAHVEVTPHRAGHILRVMANRQLAAGVVDPSARAPERHRRRLGETPRFFVLDPWLTSPAGVKVWQRLGIPKPGKPETMP